MTFSIVGFDPDTDSWGIAVASKFLAVGSLVPWGRAGAGAVATQAMANLSYGPDGLGLLEERFTAAQVVDALTRADGERDHRQLGVVDATGTGATWTGASCLEWAGGEAGDGYAVQGNVLAGPDVVAAMVAAWQGGGGALPQRLLAALAAGDRAGGDRRGRQSAALRVWRRGAAYGGVLDSAARPPRWAAPELSAPWTPRGARAAGAGARPRASGRWRRGRRPRWSGCPPRRPGGRSSAAPRRSPRPWPGPARASSRAARRRR